MYYLLLFIYLVTLFLLFKQKKKASNGIFCGFTVYFSIVNRVQFRLHILERQNVLTF